MLLIFGVFANFADIFASMTTLDSIKTALAPDLKRLNDLIRESLASDNPMMDSAIAAHLAAKGKQIRPIIVMLCAKIFGEVDERVLNAAASVELIHNASLIHDDVIDDAKLRRGHPTVNALWDNRIAVLVGDFFVSMALKCALATGDMRVIDAVGRLGTLLSLGEIDQIYNAREHHVTEDAYFKTISYKTASLFVACAQVGCYAGGADEASVARLSRVAELLGLCFQIRDDIFDYYDAGKVGKPTGNDLREGKITLPLLHVLLDTSAPKHDEMLALATSEELNDEQIAVLTAYARDNGGIDYCYRTMDRLRDEAAQVLSGLTTHEEAQGIMHVFDYIIARDF